MANRWNNPDTRPTGHGRFQVKVTCVECDCKIEFGDSHKNQRPPFFVCGDCGRALSAFDPNGWQDALEKRLCSHPLRSYQQAIVNGLCGGHSTTPMRSETDSKSETVRLLSGTPMPPDKSNERRDAWLAEVFKHWVCDV